MDFLPLVRDVGAPVAISLTVAWILYQLYKQALKQKDDATAALLKQKDDQLSALREENLRAIERIRSDGAAAVARERENGDRWQEMYGAANERLQYALDLGGAPRPALSNPSTLSTNERYPQPRRPAHRSVAQAR